MRVMRKIITKIQNNHTAMVAAPEAIPPKPNTAAMIATIKNTTAQYNTFPPFFDAINKLY